MKRALKITGGAAISMVTLALIAWFSISDTQADGDPPGGPECQAATSGCDPGICCGQITSQTAGGCTPKGCCEGSDLYCSASESRTPENFPKVAITGNGCCLVPGEDLQTRCTRRECDGTAYMCGSGTCNDTGDPQGTPLRAHPPQCRGVCPKQQD